MIRHAETGLWERETRHSKQKGDSSACTTFTRRSHPTRPRRMRNHRLPNDDITTAYQLLAPEAEDPRSPRTERHQGSSFTQPNFANAGGACDQAQNACIVWHDVKERWRGGEGA